MLSLSLDLMYMPRGCQASVSLTVDVWGCTLAQNGRVSYKI